MKRKCKNVDITDLDFIKRAILECLAKKSKRIYERPDVKSYFVEKHHSDLDSVARELQSEILNRHIELEPIRYTLRVDRSNSKERLIAIAHIKQQFYDYIANNGLDEIESRIGQYHIASKKDVGTIKCAQYVHGWLQDDSIKYCLKMDIKKFYQSVKHEKMIACLKQYVKNDTLIWLISRLLMTVEEGLPIGCFLSNRLSALYVSDIYHRCESEYTITRRGKKINVVKHQLIYADDIFIFGSNSRQLHKVRRDLTEFAKSKGLTIKEDWQMIDLSPTNKHAHIDILGYKVYRDRITMRHRNYIKLKKSASAFRCNQQSVSKARSFVATYGMNAKHTNSVRFCRKYRIYPLYKKARRRISEHDKSSI